jgi:hypothetical protein
MIVASAAAKSSSEKSSEVHKSVELFALKYSHSSISLQSANLQIQY